MEIPESLTAEVAGPPWPHASWLQREATQADVAFWAVDMRTALATCNADKAEIRGLVDQAAQDAANARKKQ